MDQQFKTTQHKSKTKHIISLYSTSSIELQRKREREIDWEREQQQQWGFRPQRRSAARLGEEEASVRMERGVAASSKKEVERRSAASGLVDSEKRQAA